MNLEADGRARRDLLGDAGIPHTGNAARRVTSQEIADATVTAQVRRDFVGVVVNRLVRFQADQIAVTVKRSVLQRHLQRLVPLLFRDFGHVGATGRYNEGDDVVNDATVTRTRLGHLHVFVFGEIGRHVEVLILVRPAGSERELFGHFNDRVGFADCPSFGELRRGGQILGVAFLRPAVNPGGDCVNLLLFEAAVIGPLAYVRVGVPRWHFAVDDFFAD